jgi:hypothetical protein
MPHRCHHHLQRISRAQVDDAGRFVLANVVNTYILLTKVEEERFAAVAASGAKEVREMEITWEGTLAAHRAEGKAEGKAEATREAILLALNRRLGPVPDEVVELLTSIADIKRLQSILEQAVSARSIDEIDFARPS